MLKDLMSFSVKVNAKFVKGYGADDSNIWNKFLYTTQYTHNRIICYPLTSTFLHVSAINPHPQGDTIAKEYIRGLDL